MKVTTQSGSVYDLDRDTMTWSRKRVREYTEDEEIDMTNPLRTAQGELRVWPVVEVGISLILQCPPLVPGTDGRVIWTSPVTEVLA